MSEREKITIENIVASTSLAEHLDLSRIALALDGSEYEPEQFPGLIYRLHEPKTAVLIFRSGKVNCTGAKNLANVKLTIDTIIAKLKKAGIEVYDNPEIVVQNIVAVYDLESELNLTDIAMSLGLENVEYEPEQFPGLVYRVEEPKVVLLLFGSGKVVCTGAKEESEIEQAVIKVKKELQKVGLI
ncbi:MAG: TATA-box-binding protein [Candidatus Thermoplasmatota archaeon]|jgi:transcription initiation factor TFIID TATA-box-binding protein|nr:TATA-box-binding protein [Candidatus Thermoplasmatota archaeon]MCL5666142.1 TATA-box-binding protein [Candidatus Thermoplasmatota archaeon]